LNAVLSAAVQAPVRRMQLIGGPDRRDLAADKGDYSVGLALRAAGQRARTPLVGVPDLIASVTVRRVTRDGGCRTDPGPSPSLRRKGHTATVFEGDWVNESLLAAAALMVKEPLTLRSATHRWQSACRCRPS